MFGLCEKCENVVCLLTFGFTFAARVNRGETAKTDEDLICSTTKRSGYSSPVSLVSPDLSLEAAELSAKNDALAKIIRPCPIAAARFSLARFCTNS